MPTDTLIVINILLDVGGTYPGYSTMLKQETTIHYIR